jgi:DNA-binding response OmpR family regulator
MKQKFAVTILVVEDDDLLSEGLTTNLQETGYTVHAVKNAADAITLLKTCQIDLMLLDLNLPGMGGMELLKAVRHDDNPVPVLVISARSSLEDRVQGLDLGANDYLTKPFELAELEARIRALLRFSYFGNRHKLTCGNLSLDFEGRLAKIDENELALSEREFIVLDALIKKTGRVVSKSQLVDTLFDKDIELSFNALDIVVHRLRKKMEGAKCSIQALKGVGYVLKEQ